MVVTRCSHNQISMVVADGQVSIWHRDICKHKDDVGPSAWVWVQFHEYMSCTILWQIPVTNKFRYSRNFASHITLSLLYLVKYMCYLDDGHKQAVNMILPCDIA